MLAGVLGSLAASRLKWLAGVIGAGLTTAALTDSCLMGSLLAKLPFNRGQGCDVAVVVAELAAAPLDRPRPPAASHSPAPAVAGLG